MSEEMTGQELKKWNVGINIAIMILVATLVLCVWFAIKFYYDQNLGVSMMFFLMSILFASFLFLLVVVKRRRNAYFRKLKE